MRKIVLGLSESILVYGKNNNKKLRARIDTGATKSSIDTKIAAELGLGPILKTKIVKSASGTSLRPMVNVSVEIGGKQLTGYFTIADRKKMKYAALIGQNILKKGNFLIDPRK